MPSKASVRIRSVSRLRERHTIHTDEVLTVEIIGSQPLRDRLPSRRSRIRSDPVLEIEDDDIDRELDDLLEEPRSVPRNEHPRSSASGMR